MQWLPWLLYETIKGNGLFVSEDSRKQSSTVISDWLTLSKHISPSQKNSREAKSLKSKLSMIMASYQSSSSQKYSLTIKYLLSMS